MDLFFLARRMASSKGKSGKRGQIYFSPGKRGQIYFSRLDEWHRVKNKSVPFSVVAGFESYALSGVPLNSAMIASRELHVAVPAETTAIQWLQMNKAIEYGESKGVKVVVSQIK